MRLPIALTLLAALALSAPLARAETGDALFKTIEAQDARLFDAYNRCDLETLGAMVSDDLEFYHDKGGLSVGRAPFLAALKANVCGKTRRDLTPGTLEVHPLAGYGALEIGVHNFCDPAKKAKCDAATDGVGKFVMLWRQQGDKWVLTRVISYDHLSDWERKK